MTKLSLPNFTSIANVTSFLEQLNEAMSALETFAETVYSRDGTTPNQLEAPLDFNGEYAVNVPTPTEATHLVRLQDVEEGIRGPKGDPGDPGAPGGPLSDGDYGDIVVTGNGTVLNFDSAVVTAAAKGVLNQSTIALMRTALGLAGAALLAVGTTAGTVAAGNDSRFSVLGQSDKTGSGNFVDGDQGCLVRQIGAGTNTFTIQPSSSIAFPVRAVIQGRNSIGSGALTIARGAGVALYVNGGTTSANATVAAGGVFTLIQEALDSWVITGVGVS